MEVLKSVLIKEVDGSRVGDKVFVVENLPKNLLFHKVVARVIDPNSPSGDRLVPEYTLAANGQRVPTGRQIEVLRDGIENSQTGDGAYCFFTQYLESQYRLRDIDNYIKSVMPVTERIPAREPYAAQPGVMTSGTRPLSALPRVVLPEPVSPPVEQTVQAGAPTPVSLPVKKARKPMSEEQKQAARERLALARAKKAQMDQAAQ